MIQNDSMHTNAEPMYSDFRYVIPFPLGPEWRDRATYLWFMALGRAWPRRYGGYAMYAT